MKIKNKINRIIFMIFIMVFYSCALSDFEHENMIDINLTHDQFTVDYIQFLDSDLVPFFYPDKINAWETIKQSNDSKLHLRTYLDYSDKLPSLFRINKASLDSLVEKEIFGGVINKEMIMQSPISISSSSYFVMSSFDIRGTFRGRNIPSALHPLINDEEDIDKIEDIINQLIGFLYTETINNSDIEFNQKHIYLNAVKNYSNELDYDVSLFDLDMSTFDAIMSIAHKHLLSIVDEKYKANVSDTWSLIKSDLMVSMLLIFNDFSIRSLMPGTVSSSNADTTISDTLMWDIDINDINGEDYEIMASSRIIHKDRMFMVALAVILLILGVLVAWIRSE